MSCEEAKQLLLQKAQSFEHLQDGSLTFFRLEVVRALARLLDEQEKALAEWKKDAGSQADEVVRLAHDLSDAKVELSRLRRVEEAGRQYLRAKAVAREPRHLKGQEFDGSQYIGMDEIKEVYDECVAAEAALAAALDGKQEAGNG